MAARVAVLFVRPDSVYFTLPGLEVYDRARNALLYPGGLPVICHPPCATWGRLAHFFPRRPGEHRLALWGLLQVRRWGGVLEHPKNSGLWTECHLPAPGRTDRYGGFCVVFPQFWFGHRAEKLTRLYVCGCRPADLPPMPFVLGEAPATVGRVKKYCLGKPGHRPEVSHKARESTPEALARWLVAVAEKCRPRNLPVADLFP